MKLLNKSLFLLLAILFIGPSVFAQQDGGRKKDKIEQLKIAFITTELALTSEEAEKFWPIYNEMAAAIKAENKLQKKIGKELRNPAQELSEADYKKKSSAILDSQIKEAQLKKEYHDKFAAIIGYKKATKLLSLEQRFKRELLNRVNNGERRSVSGTGGPRQQDEN
ncbi:MAG: hypothetical protein QNK23_06910 [Crocinitomicaceae bacterium]|nr:hypothetical protein [Crocinitomicaceae bacterium]